MKLNSFMFLCMANSKFVWNIPLQDLLKELLEICLSGAANKIFAFEIIFTLFKKF